MTLHRTVITVAALSAFCLSASGCSPAYSDARRPGNTTLQATATGALVGAGAGAAIDHRNRGRGALIGAATGAVAGAAIGNASERR